MLTNKLKMVSALALASCLMACGQSKTDNNSLEEKQKRLIQECVMTPNTSYKVFYTPTKYIVELSFYGEAFRKDMNYNELVETPNISAVSTLNGDSLSIKSKVNDENSLLDSAEIKLNGIDQSANSSCQSYLL